MKEFLKVIKEEVKINSSSVLRKSVLGIFMALIQHPKLATMQEFNLIKIDSKFSFLKDIKDLYINNTEASASIILEKISNEN